MYPGPKTENFTENLFSRMNIWPNGQFHEKPIFQNEHLAEWTIPRKTYFPEWTLARMYIWLNGQFPENLFSRMDTYQNVHLM